MFDALLYLQFHSTKNRLLRRLQRLRQPKYLVGAIVGGIYLYFYFFRYFVGARSQRSPISAASTVRDLALYESLGALALLVILLLGWIVPHKRAALAFSEAEIAFLFPAPISRRGLLHFKLLRSQTAILFTTLFLALVFRRYGNRAWIGVAGWWLILSNVNLHFLGSSFARTLLLDRGVSNWQRRLGVLVLVLAFVGLVVVWARNTLPPLDIKQLDNLAAVRAYAIQVLDNGPAPFLLYPFKLVVRPFLAANAGAFAVAAIPAVLLLVLQYFWVIGSNVAFEEASVELSRRMADKVAAIRAGKWQMAGKKVKRKRAPFTLKPIGAPAMALLWKNLLSLGQGLSLRLWIALFASTLGAVVGLGQAFGSAGWVPALGMVAAVLIVWSLIFGPQFLRQDFRHDLPAMDILKSYPVPAWQIALGELLAPAVILSTIQWSLIIIAAALFGQSRDFLEPRLVFGIALGAAVTLPFLNLITLQIPNATVLMFPAWFQAAREGAHGVEVTGQRLIFLIGQLLVLVTALVPPSLIFVIGFFLLKTFLGPGLAVPLSSVAAAIVLAGESALGLLLLGRLFKKFDLSLEQPQ